MGLPAVSVVVASRGRPGELLRCVKALRLQDHPALELIVVADPAGNAALGEGPWKAVGFDRANISAARNLGIDLAAGEVVAFIDDDAVAEPTWARRLAEAFAEPKVASAGGFVRGRNGISFQWRAMEVDRLGADHPFEAGDGVVRGGSAARAVKLQGTNCAFRRGVLAAAGGFDEALEFYLDEADVALRLAAEGWLTAVVPGADVQHGYAASPRRRADRVPLSLFDIGASTAVFLRRHAPEAERAAALDTLRAAQGARVARLLRERKIGAEAAKGLEQSLEAGIGAGRERALPELAPRAAGGAFLPLGTGPRPGSVLAGRSWQAGRLARAAEARAGAEVVTVILLSPGARPHRMRFRDEGYWEQAGGLFGRSLREGPRIRLWRFAARVAAEAARLARVRPVTRGENR